MKNKPFIAKNELEEKLERMTIAKSTLSRMFENTRNEARELEAENKALRGELSALKALLEGHLSD